MAAPRRARNQIELISGQRCLRWWGLVGGCRNINWQSYSESLQHNSAAIKCIKGGRLFFFFFHNPPEEAQACWRRFLLLSQRVSGVMLNLKPAYDAPLSLSLSVSLSLWVRLASPSSSSSICCTIFCLLAPSRAEPRHDGSYCRSRQVFRIGN